MARLRKTSTVVASLLLVLIVTARGGAAETDVSSGAASLSAWVPCANAGTGEYVALTGVLRSMTHTAELGDEGWIVRTLFNPAGVSGYGLVTGATYRGTGATSSTIVSVGTSAQYTRINNFRLISEGSAPNLTVHETLHVTVSDAGGVTAEVTNVDVDCG